MGASNIFVVLFVFLVCLHAGDVQGSYSPVVVLGCDGLGSYSFDPAEDTPTVYQEVMLQGAYTLRGRAVIQTVSIPNWAAHTLGAPPEITGITSNMWSHPQATPNPSADGLGNPPIFSDERWPSVYEDTRPYFPSVFGSIRNAGLTSVLFTDWLSFATTFIDPADPTSVVIEDDPGDLIARLEREIDGGTYPLRLPHLSFFHYNAVDHVGHKRGWGGPSYRKAVRDFDGWCKRLFGALKSRGLWDNTTIIVVSDHGGLNMGHGNNEYVCSVVPWVAKGPEIPWRNATLTTPIHNVDTSPTILAHFNVSTPSVWRGRALLELWNTALNVGPVPTGPVPQMRPQDRVKILGVIAGGVMGGVCFIFVVIIIVIVYVQTQKRKSQFHLLALHKSSKQIKKFVIA